MFAIREETEELEMRKEIKDKLGYVPRPRISNTGRPQPHHADLYYELEHAEDYQPNG